jgi:hypothetical protein
MRIAINKSDPAIFNDLYYNFCRIHQTLRVTPAMEAGVTDRLWEIEDILLLLSLQQFQKT